MRGAGYQYVNLDDCWQGQRDSLGFIHPDPQRFPSGMKALADYVHARGLRIGIYSDAGSTTCAGRPGSQGYEYQDAQQYAWWGIDYLKYGWCNTHGRNAVEAYRTMRDALAATGRPIVLGISEWGVSGPWEWGAQVGHLWRTTGDIAGCWDCEVNHGVWSSWGIMRIVDRQKGLRVHGGPGRWNDPGVLLLGNGMTTGEDRAHFSLWSMMAAPLIAGADLRRMSRQTREILINREVIAVNQDPLGVQGWPYLNRTDGVEVWFKPLGNGDWAMLYLNRADVPRRVTFDFARHVVSDSHSQRSTDFDTITYRIRDLWGRREVGTTARPFTATVRPHDVVMVRLIRG
jgi:alpha-galactosidase